MFLNLFLRIPQLKFCILAGYLSTCKHRFQIISQQKHFLISAGCNLLKIKCLILFYLNIPSRIKKEYIFLRCVYTNETIMAILWLIARPNKIANNN